MESKVFRFVLHSCFILNLSAEKRLTEDNTKLSDLIGRDGQVPDFRLRRVTLTYKAGDGAMKLDSIFYMVRFHFSNLCDLIPMPLQAVNNVVEGKHPLTPEDSVLLASYQIQAIYGDYDPSTPVVSLYDFPLYAPYI